MAAGLFGKLLARRDFIAVNLSRRFLDVWEDWVPNSLVASREELGTQWQEAFLSAPIWRFWLGSAICGETHIGALMPSLDGVGRYYPLTLAQAGAFPPPDIDVHADWFEAAEKLLLATLDDGASLECTVAALSGLGAPEATDDAAVHFAAKESTAAPSGAAFDELRKANCLSPADASFWWTMGGENFPPALFACSGMPDAALFAAMLTGEFPSRKNEAVHA